ncbi:MAG: hypothetical protein ACKOBJ_03010 [Actinomycetota bacterium]
MNRTRRMAIGFTAVVTSAGLILGGASAAQAHDRGDGPLSSLVAEGTLTSAELAAVKDALRSAHEAGRVEHVAEKKAALDAALSSLVAKGTLTQAQADAIASAERGDIRDLVRAGTVTREQVRAAHDALKAGRSESREDHRAEKAADLAAALSALVTKGTLTQAKADAVAAALADRPGRDGMKRGKGPRGGIR